MAKKAVTLFCAVAMAFYLVGCATVTVPVFEYNCLGKNRTCPAKQSSAFDFYCAACDPDHDNIEGVQTDTGSTEYVPVYPDGVGNLPVAISSTSFSSSSSSASSSSATAKPSAPSKTDREDSSDKKQEEASSTETQEKIDLPTAGELMALRQAKSYLSSPISRTTLIARLESDGFSSEEAAYAVKNCKADWNKQAEKAAEKHLARHPLYLNLLVDQLELDGFTTDEALHGATAAYNTPLSQYPARPLVQTIEKTKP